MPKTRCPLPKGQACTYTSLKCSADTSPSCIYTQYVHISYTHHPYVHQLCICSTQSKQSWVFYWVNIQSIELSLLFCWCWKKWALHWMWLLAYRLMSVTLVKVTSLRGLVHKGLKSCMSCAAWIKKMRRVDCIHIDGILLFGGFSCVFLCIIVYFYACQYKYSCSHFIIFSHVSHLHIALLNIFYAKLDKLS